MRVTLIAFGSAAMTVAGLIAVGAAVDRRLAQRLVFDRIAPGVPAVVLPRPRLPALLSHWLLLRHRRRSASADLATLLDVMARHCASGESIRQSFESAVAASPCEAIFATSIRRVRSGLTLAEALPVPCDVSGNADLVLAVHVLRLCATQGGEVSESLDRAAASLRERQALSLERTAQSAQARLSAQVLTLLPVALGAWSGLTSPSVRHFIATPVGMAAIVLGLGLNLAGWRWMNRTIEAAG